MEADAKVAREAGLGSLAVPLIGAGTGGFGENGTLELMQDELSKVEYEGRVLVVRFRRG